jgi:protein-S-isoprenylcysteine O-methyltransferase Ste14
VVIISIPVLFSFIYRINVEEKMLLQLFGEEYKQYKRYTKKLIPFLY